MEQGQIFKKNIIDIQKENMLDYFLSIIYDRAVADVNDGLKPVQRRILYTADELGLRSNKPHKKSARLVGDTMGKYHPHGDTSIYGAEVHLVQDWFYNIPLLDGHGNYGSLGGDDAAAMRYTEIRLNKASEQLMLKDMEKNAINLIPNFDNTEKEAELLPASFLNILVNGGYGIAGGYMQSIPPHNITDVCKMVIKVLKKPDISVAEIAKNLVPDFPTGGILCSKKAIENAYITGNGNVKLRAKATIVRGSGKSKDYISITEIPYMTNLKSVSESISKAIKEGKIQGVHDIEDKTSKKLDLRIIVKKDEDPEVVLNQLYKFTTMEITQKIILVCKNKNEFKVYNIKDIFTEWIAFRKSTLRRIFIFDISKLKKREHILEGLIIALNDIDNVIKIIRGSKSVNDAKEGLKKKYDLTEMQASAIVDMRLSSLVKLEMDKLKEEKIEIKKVIDEKIEYLNEDKIVEYIIEEQNEIIKKFGTNRKTDIQEIQTDISDEDIIADEDALVVITKGNFIKRVMSEFKEQKRGGKGINIGDDNITEIFSTSTKDHLLFFTNLGRVFDLKVWEIKEAGLKSRGSKIENILNMKDGEEVTNILCITNNQMDDSDSYFVFLTKNGLIKKTKLDQFNNIRKTGLIAIMLRDDDKLVSVKYIDCSKKMQDIFVATKNGMGIRYEHEELEERGRDTLGVKAINLDEGDYIKDMTVIEDENQLIFFATKTGLGKIVKITDMVKKKDTNNKDKLVDINDGFPRQKRTSNAKGRIAIKLREDDELVSVATIDDENQKLMIVSNKKMMLISSGEFRKPIKRPTFGMKLINLEEGDDVSKVLLY